jgi:hypothetical protein
MRACEIIYPTMAPVAARTGEEGLQQGAESGTRREIRQTSQNRAAEARRLRQASENCLRAASESDRAADVARRAHEE